MTNRNVRDSGWAKQIKELMKNHQVTAGVHEKDASRGAGPSNALIGFWMEYGTDAGVPPRSFLRNPFDSESPFYRKIVKSAMYKVAKKELSIKQALVMLGFAMKNDIVKAIDSNIPPALSAITIARKHSSTALIDRGDLKRSINFEVE